MKSKLSKPIDVVEGLSSDWVHPATSLHDLKVAEYIRPRATLLSI
jgi:hypothetical protein